MKSFSEIKFCGRCWPNVQNRIIPLRSDMILIFQRTIFTEIQLNPF